MTNSPVPCPQCPHSLHQHRYVDEQYDAGVLMSGAEVYCSVPECPCVLTPESAFTPPPAPQTKSGADGVLSMQVWPTYVGASQGHPLLVGFSEPDHVNYKRGQIFWETAGDDMLELKGQIIGRAQILVPAGLYTHLAYYYGPEGPCMAGEGFQLPHPISFANDGVFEVYPITNPHAAMALQAP